MISDADYEAKGLSRVLFQNLGLLASLGLVLVTVYRTLATAAYRPDVAVLVLSKADQPALIASTLMQVLMAVTPLALVHRGFLGWLLKGTRVGSTRPERVRTALAPILTAFILTSLTPLIFLAVTVYWLGRWAFRLRRERELKRAKSRRQRVHIGFYRRRILAESLGLTVFAMVAGQAILQPWMPTEVITLSDLGEQEHGVVPDKIVGRVINDRDARWLVVAKRGEVHWVPSERVTDRHLCALDTSTWTRPLPFLFRPEERKPCPALKD